MSPLIETLADLVRINSVNPEWNGPGESWVAAYVVGFLDRRGIPYSRSEVLPGRFNIGARIAGADADRSVVMEAHMDTVSAADMSLDPFAARIDGGRLYGRGA